MTTATHPTRWWHRADDGRVVCDVCPRACRLHEGQAGLCFVRRAEGGEIVLTTWGRSSGFCIDPIEKKPLHHFLPGTPVLSFGTAGCNLSCRYCQNWDITKSREIDTLADAATPAQLVTAARRFACPSIAFTYNDPIVFLEYAADVAAACREVGIRTVAVTNGYVLPGPRAELFSAIDAANVDLKSFDDAFYRQVCGGRLPAVLDTIEWLVRETPVWVELTTLVIPGRNDSEAELHALAAWVAEHLGPDVPLHFSAFHPDFKMLDVPRTPLVTLQRARRIAREHGLHHVYVGNIHDAEGSTTRCPRCEARVIEREGYRVTAYRLDDQGRCTTCGEALAGRFEGPPGSWGSRRVPVRLTEVPVP